MSTIKTIESVTRINGQDASKLDDDYIVAVIAGHEADAARLTKLTETMNSTKVAKRIADIKADIALLVIYLDSR